MPIGAKSQFPAQDRQVKTLILPTFEILAAVAPDNSEIAGLEEKMRQKGCTESPVRINLDGVGQTLLLSPQGLDIYPLESPYKTGSPSDAVYLAIYETGKYRVMIQYLAPRQRSSHHYHPFATEAFDPISGELFIWYRHKFAFKVNNKMFVDREQSHLVFTGDQSAVSFILQSGENFEHAQLQRPDLKFLLDQIGL